MFSFLSSLVLLVAAADTASAATAPILWSGALTATSARVVARSSAGEREQLLVWRATSDASSATRFAPTRVVAEWSVVQFEATALAPDTAYAYAVESNATHVGRFRTPVRVGDAFNFTFAVAACADSGANHPVFSHLAASPDVLFYLMTGDLFYGDIAVNDLAKFRAEYDRLFLQPTQRDVFAAFPIVSVPDDHDFGPNNADGTSPSKPAAHAVYREAQPHYPLAAPEAADKPLFAHAFQIGRARFIVSDLRSDKSAPLANNATRVIMSQWQVDWFKRELLNASTDASVDVVFWVEGVPFIDDEELGEASDTWGCCPAMRAELARFIHSVEPLRGRLFALSGDAHAIMVDDGSNNLYHRGAGDTNSTGFPILHAAALARPPSSKGGPYSHGCSVAYNQYGIVTVRDAGVDANDTLARRRVCVEFTGIEWSSGAEDDDDDDSVAVPSLSDAGGSLRARVRYNSCNETRSIRGDLACSGSTLAQKLAPYRTEVIGGIVLGILAFLAIIACVVVAKFKLLARCGVGAKDAGASQSS